MRLCARVRLSAASLALASAWLLTVPGSASAASTIIRTGDSDALTGPIISAGQAVWGETDGSGVWRIMSSDGTDPVEHARYTDKLDAVVPVGAPNALAVLRERITCDQEEHSCYPAYASYGNVLAGSLSEGLASLSECQMATASTCQVPYSLTASNLGVGWAEGSTYRVHRSGSEFDVPLGGSSLMPDGASLAGRYLALMTTDADGSMSVREFDTEAGTTLLHEAGRLRAISVRDDGLLVAVNPDDQLVWTSPTDPAWHSVATLAGAINDGFVIKVVGDLIAVEPVLNFPTFRVYDLAGQLIARTKAVGIPYARIVGSQWDSHWDFDGSRITWAAAPCVSTGVVIWDLHDTPPNVGAKCVPAIINTTKHVRVEPPNRVSIPLTCPQAAKAGCGGLVAGALRQGRHTFNGFESIPLFVGYEMTPGQHRPFSGTLTRLARRWIAHHPHADLILRSNDGVAHTVRVAWPRGVKIPRHR